MLYFSCLCLAIVQKWCHPQNRKYILHWHHIIKGLNDIGNMQWMIGVMRTCFWYVQQTYKQTCWSQGSTLLPGFITPPPIEEWSIVMSVPVCLWSCLQNYMSDFHRLFLCMLPMARGLVLLWQCSDMLCISGFMDEDDVTSAHKPRLLDRRCRRQAEAVRLTRSLGLGM